MYWPGVEAYEASRAFFQAPRTLSMVLSLLSCKEISGNFDPGPVYLELWSRHMGDGLIELAHEEEHAYAAGYSGKSALRRWRERIAILEKWGFILIRGSGLRRHSHVLLRPPAVVVEELRQQGLVDSQWYQAYRDLQIRVGEVAPESGILPKAELSHFEEDDAPAILRDYSRERPRSVQNGNRLTS
jgi:hypothetical protein